MTLERDRPPHRMTYTESARLNLSLHHSKEDLKLFQERAESNPNYEGLLFAADHNALGMVAEVRVLLNDDAITSAPFRTIAPTGTSP